MHVAHALDSLDAISLGILFKCAQTANRRPGRTAKLNGADEPLAEGAFPMGVRELAKLFGVAIRTMQLHLKTLERAGLIRRRIPGSRYSYFRRESAIYEIQGFEEVLEYFQSLKPSGSTGKFPKLQNLPVVDSGGSTPLLSLSKNIDLDRERKSATTLPKLAELWNEHKSELLPPVLPEELKAKTRELAEELWEKKPNEEGWIKTIRTLGESLWLTGQVAGSDGKLFDVSSAFAFMLRQHVRITKGEYSPTTWGRKPVPIEKPKSATFPQPTPTSLHNFSNAARQEKYPSLQDVRQMRAQLEKNHLKTTPLPASSKRQRPIRPSSTLTPEQIEANRARVLRELRKLGARMSCDV